MLQKELQRPVFNIEKFKFFDQRISTTSEEFCFQSTPTIPRDKKPHYVWDRSEQLWFKRLDIEEMTNRTIKFPFVKKLLGYRPKLVSITNFIGKISPKIITLPEIQLMGFWLVFNLSYLFVSHFFNIETLFHIIGFLPILATLHVIERMHNLESTRYFPMVFFEVLVRLGFQLTFVGLVSFGIVHLVSYL
ncbi:TPA: hypothetical protein QDB06_000826 [Burkholderia vietnamiensis]|nr:hypothetical protein [Burkholderia vietnamiensis]